jgi:hypothetical protein
MRIHLGNFDILFGSMQYLDETNDIIWRYGLMGGVHFEKYM